MDLYEMRKKFREQKAQTTPPCAPPQPTPPTEQTSQEGNIGSSSNSTPPRFWGANLSGNNTNSSSPSVPSTNPKEDTPSAKSGNLSVVTISDATYRYEKEDKVVPFSCSRLDNAGEEHTGMLYLSCWISQKPRIDNQWQDSKHELVDTVELGTLEKGYGFSNLEKSFTISQKILKDIKRRNENNEEWHFVFTVRELHEDGQKHIIFNVCGPNENLDFRTYIETDGISVSKEADTTTIYLDGYKFTGDLLSYDRDIRILLTVRNGQPCDLWGFHQNRRVSFRPVSEGSADNVYYNNYGEKISKSVFDHFYGRETEKMITQFYEGLYSKIGHQPSRSERKHFTAGDSVSSRLKKITLDKLEVETWQVVNSASFMDDLGADSLEAGELMMEVESEFGITISETEMNRVRTFGDAVKLIETKLKCKP